MPVTNIRKKTLHRPAVILACAVLLCFIFQDGMTGFNTNPVVSYSLAILTILILAYEIIQLIRRKPVMAISEYGIDFMHYGSYPWEQIASFWFEDETDADNFTTRQLIFRLKDSKELRLHYPELNKKPDEITDIIRSHENNVSFGGYKKIGL